MDVNKAKSYLKKINRLFDGVEQDNGQISMIEKDLMLSYVRDFYETFFDDNNTPVVPKPQPVVATPKPQYQPVEPVRVERQPTPEPKPEPKSEPKSEPKIERQPIVFEVEMPKPKPKPQPIVEQKEVEQPVEVPQREEEIPSIKPIPKIEVPKAREIFREPVREPEPAVIHQTHQPIDFDEFDVLFEEEKATDLSQKLSQSKVDNLRNAMGINERFLIQNELFGGNNSVFNDAIDKLNSFNNFLQAKAYIIKELAPQNEWLDEKRLKRAKSFIKTINRRYK